MFLGTGQKDDEEVGRTGRGPLHALLTAILYGTKVGSVGHVGVVGWRLWHGTWHGAGRAEKRWTAPVIR